MRSAPANALVATTLLACLVATGCKQDHGPAKLIDEAAKVANERAGEVRSVARMKEPARTTTARVQHILIAWAELGRNWGSGMDPRAKERDFEGARKVVRGILKRIESGESFDTLVRELSEDPGSASGKVYEVTSSANLVAGLKAISLRLNPGEVGVTGSRFGLHIVRRVR